MKKHYLDLERAARDREASVYDALIVNYQHLVEWRTLWKRLNISRYDGALVLDAGCGTGRFSIKLMQAGKRVAGADYSLESLRVAQQRTAVESSTFVQADARSLPFRGESFSQILCSQTIQGFIQHADAVALLRELWRVLRPGGQLVMTTENYRLFLRMTKERLLSDGAGHNFRRYTRREFRDLLREVASPEEIVGIWGVLNLVHKPMPFGQFLPRPLWPVLLAADLWLERTPLAGWTGKLWLAELRKRT